jgi:hypothetical protein
MPEQIGHGLDVHPRLQPRHGRGVPQRVNADARHPGGLRRAGAVEFYDDTGSAWAAENGL